MATDWSNFDTDWSNFDNWLNSGQGWIFGLVLVTWLSLIPILILLRYPRGRYNLVRAPAIAIWLALGLLPMFALAVLYATGSIRLGRTGFGLLMNSLSTIFVLVSVAPLLAGLAIQWRRRKPERLHAGLMWFGVSLQPILLVLLIVPWTYFPTAGISWMVVSAAPLIAGIIGLIMARQRARGAPRP